jgi:branched-chain amino acid transport system ATP-binding protein
LLSLKNIVVYYGGVQALKGISLEIEEGTITGLIGSNGAGKTTTLRAISGLIPISSGEIWFGGRRIDGRSPERIVSLGIVQVPEGKRLFLEMTVLDNLLAGAYLRKDKDRLGRDLKRIYGYFPVLEKAQNRLASHLSGGEQQMLAIGRGLMASPKLLLLDEPSLGLSPLLTKEVAGIIRRIAQEGVSILLIEQNANLAFQLVRKIYVMETGTITLEGHPSDLQNDPHVKEAYLGLARTEEMQIGQTLQAKGPAVGPSDVAAQKRWQDKILQKRFQDRVPPERWQDKGLHLTPESGVVQKTALPGFARQPEIHEMSKNVRQTEEIAVRPPIIERWPDERRKVASYNHDRYIEESLAEKEMQKKRYISDRWGEKGEELEGRPALRSVHKRVRPPRIVKRTFTPAIQTFKDR